MSKFLLKFKDTFNKELIFQQKILMICTNCNFWNYNFWLWAIIVKWSMNPNFLMMTIDFVSLQFLMIFKWCFDFRWSPSGDWVQKPNESIRIFGAGKIHQQTSVSYGHFSKKWLNIWSHRASCNKNNSSQSWMGKIYEKIVIVRLSWLVSTLFNFIFVTARVNRSRKKFRVFAKKCLHPSSLW